MHVLSVPLPGRARHQLDGAPIVVIHVLGKIWGELAMFPLCGRRAVIRFVGVGPALSRSAMMTRDGVPLSRRALKVPVIRTFFFGLLKRCGVMEGDLGAVEAPPSLEE